MKHIKLLLKISLRIIFSILLFVTVVIILLWIIYFFQSRLVSFPKPTYGVTFSTHYSNSLGLDPMIVLLSLLDELEVKRLRIPVYWTEVEAQKGNFDFSYYDRILDTVGQKNAQVILAIGYKLPRWPECFAPSWALNLPYKTRQQETLIYLQKTIEHFKDRSEVIGWQVENEPLFQFGMCGRTDTSFLGEEINLVKSLDNKPIYVTDSGEVGWWLWPMRLSNQMGTSLYKKTWNPTLGYFEYPIPPFYYPAKAWFIKSLFAPNSEGIYISELQAEPWTAGTPIPITPLEEQTNAFSIKQFKDNLSYATQTGVVTQDLWGAEWWYWMKERGHPEYWNLAQELF